MKAATFANTQIAGARRRGHVTGLIRNRVRAVSTWNKRRLALRELYALSDRQLADIGLMRADIPTVVNKLLSR